MSAAFGGMGTFGGFTKRPVKTPSVDFWKRDLQDEGPVSEAGILRTYAGARRGGNPHVTTSRIYRSNVPVQDMPDPKLAEHFTFDKRTRKVIEISEDHEDFNSYDWSELQRGRGSPPPPKLHVKPDGTTELLDGNHRTHFWLTMDRATYTHIPCWIIDDRPTGFFGDRRPGDDEDDDE